MSNVLPASSLHSRLGTLVLAQEVGKGNSSVVYHSRTELDSHYAVKAIHNQPDIKRYKRTLREIALHTRVGEHRNILPLLDVFSEPSEETWPSYTYLILPLASADLHSLILDRQLYLNNPLLIRTVFLQIVSAVQHCHSLGVFHRDIKSENILTFDHGWRIMLADFGLATTSTRSCEWGVGTITYMSPECVEGPKRSPEGYSPAANDVWSLGIVLITLLTARIPWRTATWSDSAFVAYCSAPNNYLLRSLPFSRQAHRMLCQIFVPEEQRLSIHELMGGVAAMRVWYDVDAVFEDCMARWRQPEDRVTLHGWVCAEGEDATNCACTPPPPPPPPGILDALSETDTELYGPPELSSTSGLSGFCSGHDSLA